MGDTMKKKLIGMLVVILFIATVLQVTGHQNYENVDWNNTITENQDWSMFRREPYHTAFTTSSSLDTNNALWINTTGPEVYPRESHVQSSPAITNNNAYIRSYTGCVYCFEDLDQSPSEPTISGPTAGGPEIELNFSAVATDPEENQIYYRWDWGDGNISDWSGPFDSNESITINHNWTNNGEYEIRAKAKNVFNNESDWSEPHNISIAEQIEISNIKLGFVYLRTFFTNNSYAYIYLLETLGLSVVISDEGLPVEAAVTDAVNSVTFELIDILWGDQINQEDDNSSDGFSTHFEIPSSLLQITVYAYDENGTMIDIDKLDYLVFIDLTSGEESQQIGQIGRMRYRIRERIRDRLLHH